MTIFYNETKINRCSIGDESMKLVVTVVGQDRVGRIPAQVRSLRN